MPLLVAALLVALALPACGGPEYVEADCVAAPNGTTLVDAEVPTDIRADDVEAIRVAVCDASGCVDAEGAVNVRVADGTVRVTGFCLGGTEARVTIWTR